MRILACLILLLAAPAAQAQMYKCTEGGRTRYSDKPITDCKNVEVKGKANTYAGTPTPVRRRGQVSKEQVQHDSRCTQLQREHAALQRSPDSAAREQRLQSMRSEFAGCN
jgi:hypothetical protein